MAEFNGVRGCKVILRPTDAFSGPALAMGRSAPVATAQPTLGEILDMLSDEYPERVWACDPALRDVRVGSVTIQDR